MKPQRGFTLIEIMVAVAIIGIIAAVAIPSYANYVTRSRLSEAFSALSAVPASAEQYWSNNRTYANFDGVPATTKNFSYALSGATASAFTVTATGKGSLAGHTFTINQAGTRATTQSPWATNGNGSCWVDRKDGSCTQ